MEIKFFRVVNKGKFIASFSAVGKTMELHKLKLMQGSDGLFVSEPSESYQAKDGTTKYAKFYVIMDEKLRNEILAGAEAELQKHGVNMVQDTIAPQTADDDDLPF